MLRVQTPLSTAEVYFVLGLHSRTVELQAVQGHRPLPAQSEPGICSQK